jgi:hypothetical protein
VNSATYSFSSRRVRRNKLWETATVVIGKDFYDARQKDSEFKKEHRLGIQYVQNISPIGLN